MGRYKEEEITKRHEETFGDDGYLDCLDCGDDFMGISMSKLIELCMSTIYYLLYVNYT